MLQERIEQHMRDVPDFPKPGILFKDITPIFLNPSLTQEIINEFAGRAKGKIDAVCGIESRGFLFGVGIANALGVPFILVRKAGKLPGDTLSQTYDLEYGQATIEISKDYIQKGQRVLIHDDVLATGGTAKACADLVEKLGGTAAQFSFLINLSFLNGIQKLEGYNASIESIITY